MGKKNTHEDVNEHIETFHRFSLYVPSRLIKLESDMDLDSGEEYGVSQSMSSPFLKNLAILESISHDPITILFNTQGGDVLHGLAIYDAIKASPCEITMKVYGVAYSMGSVILQAADNRLLSIHSTVMFHDGEDGVGGNSHETLNRAIFNKAIGTRTDDILFNRINEKRIKDGHAKMARHTFDAQSLKSRWLFAQEAIDLGLADGIIDAPISE